MPSRFCHRPNSSADAGNTTKGGKDNEAYLVDSVLFGEDIQPARRSVLFDPQTSGGLAICVAADRLMSCWRR